MLVAGSGPSGQQIAAELARAGRRVVLAVDAVVGISRIPSTAFDRLPPLLGASNAEAISSIGTLDAQLLLVLRSTRLVPEEVWARLHTEASAA